MRNRLLDARRCRIRQALVAHCSIGALGRRAFRRLRYRGPDLHRLNSCEFARASSIDRRVVPGASPSNGLRSYGQRRRRWYREKMDQQQHHRDGNRDPELEQQRARKELSEVR